MHSVVLNRESIASDPALDVAIGEVDFLIGRPVIGDEYGQLDITIARAHSRMDKLATFKPHIPDSPPYEDAVGYVALVASRLDRLSPEWRKHLRLRNVLRRVVETVPTLLEPVPELVVEEAVERRRQRAKSREQNRRIEYRIEGVPAKPELGRQFVAERTQLLRAFGRNTGSRINQPGDN